jgi:hypothetical protein
VLVVGVTPEAAILANMAVLFISTFGHDMLFGTFKNPETFEGEVGFYDGASDRVLEMLVGRDVTEPRAPGTPAPEIRASAEHG